MEPFLHAEASKGRFAPSPTGRMHAGNIFSALVSWIVAKRAHGSIVLRIEDLDASRSRSEYADLAQKDFSFLGLEWDEGPYFQSDRFDLYRDAFEEIKRCATVYPCFCSRADLNAASAPHAGEHAVYPGTCKHKSAEERQRLTVEGKSCAWRLEVPQRTIRFDDLFQGACTYDLAHDCGDFVLARNDASFAYQLAVVVDDADMGIDVVVRGSDLLSSTPQQIHLAQVLGYNAPAYAHVPLFVTKEGRRIAKREKDAGLDALMDVYGTPERILGHIAYVAGLVDVDEAHSAQELLACANLEALIGKKQVVWDEEASLGT